MTDLKVRGQKQDVFHSHRNNSNYNQTFILQNIITEID